MQYILSLLPLLACPVGMSLLMWFTMRTNKDQPTHEAGRVPMSAYSEPMEVANDPPDGASLLKTIISCLKMCLNWKVLAGLAVVGLIVLVVAPQLLGAALPILIIAACPLSMLFMMRSMSGNRNATTQMQGDQLPVAGVTRDDHLAALKSRLSSMQTEQETLSCQIAEMESPEVPIVSEAEAVACEASERNRKRTAHHQK
jgi:hypothetical protein